MLKLSPRLNYKYDIGDAYWGLQGIIPRQMTSKTDYWFFGTNKVLFVNHARTGIRIALTCLGLPPNAKIGVMAFNCHTVFQAVEKAGFSCVFIDINDCFQLHIDDLKKKANTIDALIVTHLFGLPSDMLQIKATIPNLPIIEDCAHSFLTKIKNRYTGLYGNISVFSMGKGKFPAIGDGGVLVFNSNPYFSEAKKIVNSLPKTSSVREFFFVFKSLALSFLHTPLIYGLLTSKLKKTTKSLNHDKHHEACIPRSSFLLFNAKSKDFSKYKRQQCENLHNYHDKYKGVVQRVNNSSSHHIDLNCFMLPCIIIKDKAGFMSKLEKRGVEVGEHFSNAVRWAVKYGYNMGDCPNTEEIVERVITLPTHYNYNPRKIHIINQEMIRMT